MAQMKKVFYQALIDAKAKRTSDQYCTRLRTVQFTLEKLFQKSYHHFFFPQGAVDEDLVEYFLIIRKDCNVTRATAVGELA